MSWNDYHRRRNIMDAVLADTRRDPGTRLNIDRYEGARELFGTEENLLLALQYRWTQVLGGRLRASVGGPEDVGDLPRGGQDDHDHIDAVSRAWRTAAQKNPELRLVLDTHLDRHLDAYPALRERYEAEMRMLAVTAGLAEPGDSAEEVTRIGTTFAVLLREGMTRRPAIRRQGQVAQWLRRLAPTG